MSPEDEATVARSIGNLWTWQAVMLARITSALRGAGLSDAALEKLLEQLDEDTASLGDGDDQHYCSQIVANARAALRRGE